MVAEEKLQELSRLSGIQIEKPEVLPSERTLHIDEALTAGQEAMALSICHHTDRGKVSWLAIRADR